MRITTRLTLLGATAGLLTLWAACLYPERNVRAFDPNTEFGKTAGRLHVQPNPIHLQEALLPFGGNCRTVELINIGTEPLVLSRITLEGAPTLWHSSTQHLPWTVDPEWIHGFQVCSDDSVEEPREGFLVLETDDPAAPVVRVPILTDSDPFQEPPDPFRPYPHVSPNPVRLVENAESGLVEVVLTCERCDDQQWLRLDEAEATGSLVEIEAIRSPVETGATLSLPAKLPPEPSGQGSCAIDLRVVAPEPMGLKDTLSLWFTNWLGERYQIDLPVLTD